MTPEDLAAARRARLVDDSGKLTYAGRVLVGERPGALEPRSEFARRWAAKRGPLDDPKILALMLEAGGP